MHFTDRPANDASPFFGRYDKRHHHMVVDRGVDTVSRNGQPDEWHVMQAATKGLTTITLTTEACGRLMPANPVPLAVGE